MNNKIFLAIFLGLVLIGFAGAKGIGPITWPDSTPPVISNVATMQVCGEGVCGPVCVLWTTDEASYFNMVEYGRGNSYEYSVSEYRYDLNIMIPQPALQITLDKPGNYHYRVTSCDFFGNCAYSEGYKVKK